MLLMQHIREFILDFSRDLFQAKLFFLKATYFFLLFGVVILWPQFSIHQQELGITAYQTGIYGSIVSALGIFLPFLSGIVGDKLGNYKVLMCLTTLLAGIPALLFDWVPSAKVDHRILTDSINISSVNATAGTFVSADITSGTNITLNSSLPADNVDPEQLVRTFWYYLVVRVSYGILQSTGYLLFEAAVMANMQASGVNFGYQRVWGTVAAVLSSIIGGYIIESTGSFSVTFYIAGASQFITGILMLGVATDFKPPSRALAKGILKYFFNVEVILFFTAMLFAGILFGFVETFMYRYLYELGATPLLINLTVSVGAPFEIVFTLLATYCVKMMGHAPVVMLGLMAYAIRLLGFSFLNDPWWVLPLEILECVANGLLQTTSIMYCTVLFSLETIASFRGIFAVAYSGVGKLLGTIIGSEIREILGDRKTFRIFAVAAVIFSSLYFVAYQLMKRCRSIKSAPKISAEASVKDSTQLRREDNENIETDLGVVNKGCEDM